MRRQRALAWGRGIAGMLLALTLVAAARSEVPSLPNLVPVPASSQPPLSSAQRPGTEYSDLAKAGYVEEEYYLSGVAPAITATGETLFQAPYITRILVRKPKDPARFNGTVIIEPFTWFGERGAGWILTRHHLLREGYAHVGYTLNINKPEQDPKFPPSDMEDPERYLRIVNLDFMRRFDYARYAPLGFYYDPARFKRGELPDPFVPQSQGVGAQLALLLKTNDPDGALAGLNVQRVYVNSWAVTAQVWMDYLDQGRHQQWRMPDGRPLIDAYMTGRMAYGEVGGEIIRVPRKMPDDAPFITVYTQSELRYDAVNGIALPADTDRPPLRYYEVLGVPHLRQADDVGFGAVEPVAADVGKGNDPNCNILYDEPAEFVVAALLKGMDQWVQEGKPMARASRVKRSGRDIVRDPVTENLIGGIRPPWVVVPAAKYMVEEETNCGLALDTKIPYSAKKLRKLYGRYENYQRKFQAAKATAIAQGYLLPEDAPQLEPVAKPDDFRGR